jgi:hypothetical protein
VEKIKHCGDPQFLIFNERFKDGKINDDDIDGSCCVHETDEKCVQHFGSKD